MKNEMNLTMLTDFYEFTMMNGFFAEGYKDKIAYFDMFFRRVPEDGGFAIMAGVEQIIEYIKRNYNPISGILYGSYADGTNNLNSDFVQIFDGKITVDSNERGKALQVKVISHIQNRPQKSKAEIDAISLFWSEKDIEMDGAKSPYCICSL